ncbi:MAG: DUF6779 domain-containing protein, partial [Gordonia sp. (in: high G+C Gram-positive bacteria)]|uniref:DUF6779 domain-containing protein n=1 Tax=Gordonia sp. (in: high G+C Gram-positive bacteria) TaxID=84139 RepID=UPI003C73926A
RERSEEAKTKRPSTAGQWLIGLLVLLALIASLLMVLGNDFSIQATLAVIAALWAAVIGAVLVTKYRRQADVAESRSRDLRLVYELQLEREISARRQYESDVEVAIRQEISAESNVELDELKAQVLALRSSLEQLLGKPLPDARVAIGLERPRELGAGRTGYTAAAADDRFVADRDFATTAPPSDTGRHVPTEPQDVEEVDPVEMTEIIPVVTEDPEADETPQTGPFDRVAYSAQAYEPPAGPSQQPRPQQPRAEQARAEQPRPQRPRPQEPRPQQPRREQARPSQPRPQQPVAEVDEAEGTHSEGRPASELLSRLRAASENAAPSREGGRRRRD